MKPLSPTISVLATGRGSVCIRPILLLLYLTAVPAQAQPGAVTGVVRTATGEALPGVNLTITGTPLGAATDTEGRFLIHSVPPGAYTLVASAIGFRTERQPFTIGAGATVTTSITMSEIVLEAAGLVVTAGRREQQVGTVPVSISIVTPQAIETRNWVALDDALRHVPGVQLSGSTVNVRGSSGFAYSVGSRVLLLVDGNPMLGPDQGNVPFDVLPMAQIERIEVVKGPGSALYGGGALGGVINVLTRDFPETPETRIWLYGGGYEPVRHQVWKNGWDEAGSARFFGGTNVTHARRINNQFGFWTNLSYRASAGYLDASQFSNLHVNTKAEWNPAPGRSLTVFGGFLHRKREDFLFWQSGRDALIPADTDFLDGSAGDARIRRYSFLPVFTHVVNPRLFYTVKGRFYGTRIRSFEEEGLLKDEDDTAANRLGSEIQINWRPSDSRFVTTGVTGDLNMGESEFYVGTDGDEFRPQPEGGAYTQVEQRIGRRLNLIGGARVDVYRFDVAETITRFSPKASLSYEAMPMLTMRASFGQGFRAPSIAERFVNSRDYLPIVPNLSLRPEESTGVEVGLKGLLPLGARAGVQLDVAGFRNDYENLVEPKFTPLNNAFQFINLTDARIRGVESVLSFGGWEERISAQVGYLYLNAEDLSSGESLPLAFRAKHLLQTTLSLRPTQWLDLGIDFRAASRPERLDSDFTRFVPDSDLMGPTKVLDLRVGFERGVSRVAVLVKNALDYYYVERPALLAPPRHVLFQLQLDV